MPLQSVCPRCGRPSLGLCAQCTIEGHTLAAIPAHLNITICPTCSDYLCSGKWISCDLDSAIRRTIESALLINAVRHTVYIEVTHQDKSTIKVQVTVEGTVGDKLLTKDFEVDIRIRRETCERCNRVAGGYYGGLVQVRAEGRTPTEDELLVVSELVHKLVTQAQQTDRMGFLSKITRNKDGLDFYVGTAKVAKQIARAINNEFGGKLKESPKLVGKKEGRNIYRITFSVRLPRFEPHSILFINDHVYEMRSAKQFVTAIDLQTGERRTFSLKELERAELLGTCRDAKESMLVSVNTDEVQLLDPDTYATLTVPRPQFMPINGGRNTLTIKTARGVFLLP